LLAAAGFFNDLDEAGLELFDGGDVVCEDAHVAGLSWEVHLDAVFDTLVSQLVVFYIAIISAGCIPGCVVSACVEDVVRGGIGCSPDIMGCAKYCRTCGRSG
jgi:hypothetical protein